MKIQLPRDKNYHPDRVCLQYKKDQFDERENQLQSSYKLFKNIYKTMTYIKRTIEWE